MSLSFDVRKPKIPTILLHKTDRLTKLQVRENVNAVTVTTCISTNPGTFEVLYI